MRTIRNTQIQHKGRTAIFGRIRKIAKSDCLHRHVCPSVSSSARPHGTTRIQLEEFS
jgi:hypothetical protein